MCLRVHIQGIQFIKKKKKQIWTSRDVLNLWKKEICYDDNLFFYKLTDREKFKSNIYIIFSFILRCHFLCRIQQLDRVAYYLKKRKKEKNKNQKHSKLIRRKMNPRRLNELRKFERKMKGAKSEDWKRMKGSVTVKWTFKNSWSVNEPKYCISSTNRQRRY